MTALPLPQDDAAGCPGPKGARPIVNETKVLIVAVMGEFGRPVTAGELYAVWDGAKPLHTFNYHLDTLVKAGVVEVVLGPELYFQLIGADAELNQLSGSGAAGACGFKRTESEGSAGN